MILQSELSKSIIGSKKEYVLGKPQKKVLFFLAGPLRGGRGLNVCATKEKRTFFNVREKVPMATKPRGGWTKGLKNFFCGFPYSYTN